MKKLIVGGLTALAIGLTGCGAAVTDTSPAKIGGTAVAAPATVAQQPVLTEDEQLRAWGQDADEEFTAVQNDMFAFSDAASNVDIPGVRATSRQLADDLDALEAKLPTPNAGVTAELQAAIDDYRAMTDIGVTLTEHTPVNDIESMTVLIESGTAHVSAATELLKDLLA